MEGSSVGPVSVFRCWADGRSTGASETRPVRRVGAVGGPGGPEGTVNATARVKDTGFRRVGPSAERFRPGLRRCVAVGRYP
jgi:hypothetical protein